MGTQRQILMAFIVCLLLAHTGIKAQTTNHLSDLPLQISGKTGTLDVLMIYITGDGGWNYFNQELVRRYEESGYGVIALNSRKYFWNEKSPEIFAHDFEQLAGYYLKLWKKTSILVVGYSFGADVAGFLPNYISPELQSKIKKIVLISPSASTDFVIRLSDLVLTDDNAERKYKLSGEIERTGLDILAVFGMEEGKILKSTLKEKKNLSVKILPGDHRYNNNFPLLSGTTAK